MSTPRRAGYLGDSRLLSSLGVIIAIAVTAAMFTLSYQGLAIAGEELGLRETVLLDGVTTVNLVWIVAVAIDGSILVAGLMAAVLRGQKRSARLELWILWLATITSSVINALAHLSRGDSALGIGLAAIAPWFFLAMTESIIRALIQDEVIEKKPRKSKAAPVIVAAPAETAPIAEAPKPRPVARPVAPRVPIEAASPEASALLAEFDTLVNSEEVRDPNGSPESERLTAIVLSLVDEHSISATDLAARAGHENPSKLRARLTKARKRLAIAA